MSRRLLSSLLLCLPLVGLAAVPERAHTAGPSVRVFSPPLQWSVLGYPRQLRIYLPPDYGKGQRRYPVLYMFDAQNLFDDATSYAGEWGVDESLDALAREDGFAAIVVGIDHGNEVRINELIPYWNVRFLPNTGAGFVEDLVQTVKPFIDANFRTRPGRADTAIMGSSLGGLSADYAIHRYPEVFGKAGVFSPAYWVSEEPFKIAARTPLPAESRVYLYMGGKEGDEAVPLVQRMEQVLRTQPDMADRVTLQLVPDAGHNEAAWRAAFPVAVRWLFGLAPPAHP
ncbi:hypothetical protein N800_11915 [Lysobacter daejeonensis GH1-9]|uniref:Esterase n=1 Tax=Lysobacter daejeonensis GH1-9 TaxID=1385517 RepID=A0A0A0EZU4_9GAMM|nr:alpha/beta hydrolase-fold protein [Lysobacter daejeonensis]KGM55810.1 hypothetical protein N800_11915 [Lysobacter daejeonensis GH1-9]